MQTRTYKHDGSWRRSTTSDQLTRSISPSTSRTIHTHFRKVFSSVPHQGAMHRCWEYCFKKRRHHSRCFVCISLGSRSFFSSQFQMAATTGRLTPKCATNQSCEVLVYLFDILWMIDSSASQCTATAVILMVVCFNGRVVCSVLLYDRSIELWAWRSYQHGIAVQIWKS